MTIRKHFLLKVSYVAILILLPIIGYLSYSNSARVDLIVKENASESGDLKNEPVAETNADATSTLLFVGDIMLSRSIGKIMVQNNDWNYPFLKIADVLKGADLTFANLEGPISDRGTKVGSIYSFRADPRSVAGLKYAGIDVVSVANNHIWDYGADAFDDTLKILTDNDIQPIGGGPTYEAAHTPVIKDVKGTKIAFLGYTNLLPHFLGLKDAHPSVAYPDEAELASDIQNAKKLADIVIVSFHWGDEYHTSHNAFQEHLAHLAIDSGASLVVGHHPHVAEEVQQYNGGYIAYSLGNFVFDQNFSDDTSFGLMLNVTLKGKAIQSVTSSKVRFDSTYQPYIEPYSGLK